MSELIAFELNRTTCLLDSVLSHTGVLSSPMSESTSSDGPSRLSESWLLSATTSLKLPLLGYGAARTSSGLLMYPIKIADTLDLLP